MLAEWTYPIERNECAIRPPWVSFPSAASFFIEFDFLSMICQQRQVESQYYKHIPRSQTDPCLCGPSGRSQWIYKKSAVRYAGILEFLWLTDFERSLPHSTAIKASPKLFRGSGCGWLKGSFVVLFKYAPCPRTAWYSWSRKGLYTTLRADTWHENVCQSSQKLGKILKTIIGHTYPNVGILSTQKPMEMQT